MSDVAYENVVVELGIRKTEKSGYGHKEIWLGYFSVNGRHCDTFLIWEAFPCRNRRVICV